ncbi:GIN domain-containing protein [Flavobacterium rhizosphaerae]|uniref:DUF2807 domain-containing protein n=1 Tax=Flavobacterium rhizosphaerae TaxID=3163298 RepID=A0ABW8YYU8_9FLAO
MKTLFTAAALAAFCLINAQQTIGIKPFKSISVGPDMNITMIKSNQNKVVINDADDDNDELQVVDNGESLTLNGDGTATVYYTEDLENITVAPDSNFSCNDEIKSNSLNLTAASDAIVTLAVNVKTLNTTANSDAVVTLIGKAKRHVANYSSDAVLNAKELETQDTIITLSSDAGAAITVKNTVDATVNSDAALTIYGNPGKVKQSKGEDAEITIVK